MNQIKKTGEQINVHQRKKSDGAVSSRGEHMGGDNVEDDKIFVDAMETIHDEADED